MRRAGLRPHWPRWPVTLTLVGAISAGGAVAIAKWPHASWWLVVVTAMASAVTPPALAALSQGSQRRQEIGRVARAGLQNTTGAGGSKLPIAGTADLEARVHQTVLPIPYIQRDEENTIRAHLRAGYPVLLIGSSMVGKTKMAARVVAEEFSSWPVAIPDSKTALADLEANDVKLQGTVIWLDDIDRLIGADGISDGALRRLAATGNIIVGTIRARAYDQLQPSDQLRLPQWDALCVFEHVFVKRDLSEKEQERLACAVADRDIQDRILTVGLGEYVGAARQVAEALELGAAGTDPLGYALVLAAADWRRCGMTRPVPASVLRFLARQHLDNRGESQLAEKDAFHAGLAWATRDINSNVALLQPAGTDSYVVYDYALDLISAQARPISDTSWAAIISNASPAELLIVGLTAANSYHRNEIAIQAWRRAENFADPREQPLATFGIGGLLMHQGDVAGAEEAFQKVIDSGHALTAPRAALCVGILLAGQGDVAGAGEAFEKAIDSGHYFAAPLASLGYGQLLARQGDLAGAKKAYQKAIESEDAQAAPMAAFHVGWLLGSQGDVAAAKEALQKAIDSGHAQAAPMASLGYGELLARQGDLAGAKKAYQKAIDSGDFQTAPYASLRYGKLLAGQGNVAGAKEAFQKAINSGNANAAQAARNALIQLPKEQQT